MPQAWEESGENPRFLTEQLPTYLGNKRALLGNIDSAIRSVRERLGNRPLRMFDAFCGSGAVSRLMKQHAQLLAVNDLEPYAAAVADCYLTNSQDVDTEQLQALIEELNRRADQEPIDGFIRRLYSPQDDAHIQAGERAFYTSTNAARLDTYATAIHALPSAQRKLLLGPLLYRASVHANTGGVFKGFYKDKANGVGKFGGTNADALSRITSRIQLDPPVLSNFDAEVIVMQEDAAKAARSLQDLDLVYLDPPYNQHPYGSNYFMLNLLTTYTEPQQISEVSGIPADWQRSAYNNRQEAPLALRELIKSLDSRFVMISYSDEGFITPAQMRDMLSDFGHTTVHDINYPTYRASRNLASRPLSVTEHLYLLERS